MELILTIEAQKDATENGLADILNSVNFQLRFITQKDIGLETIDNYGTEFKSIAIIPSCMSDEFWDALGWKERKKIWRKRREADIRLRMDYNRFMKETYENKRLMFIDTIIKSIEIIQERSREDFDGERLIKDILKALAVKTGDD